MPTDRRGVVSAVAHSEQLLYDRRSGEGRIVRGADAVPLFWIWKDDVISFPRHAPCRVLNFLSRWYDVRFETDGQPRSPHILHLCDRQYAAG